MTMEITIHIPALDHLAQVLEGRDLAVLVDDFHRELDERLDAMARNRVAEAIQLTHEAKVVPLDDAAMDKLKSIEAAPEPAPASEAPTGRERASATSPSEPKVSPGVAAAAPCGPTEPTVSMTDIRNACAALRDAGKLPAVQELLKAHDVRNLSALKPEQIDSFADGLRNLGARL